MPTDDSHERYMRLFLRHEPEILRSILLFIPCRADAHDVMQETALALWKHFGEYDPERPFVNWACGFARIEVRRFLRRVQRRAAFTEAAAMALMETAEGQAHDARDLERHLAACRARLREDQRRLLDGYYLEEESVTLLAQRHACSTDAIYKSLQRIRHALLDCIARKTAEATR